MNLKILRMSALLVLAAVGASPLSAAEYTLENDQVIVTCQTKDGRLLPASLQDKKTGQIIHAGGQLFGMMFDNGSALNSGDFTLVGEPRIEPLPVNPNASRFSERLPGRELVADMAGADGNLKVTWHCLLRDGSRYLRQEMVIRAGKTAAPLKSLSMLDMHDAAARATGTMDGCPVADKTSFYGLEHPLSVNRCENGRVRCSLPRGAALEPGEETECSLVIGFVRPGQLRRDFLAYLERERAHPYRTFLHYNSWYDLGRKYDEAAAVHAIHALGEELTVKRGVTQDSFMFDDGWDDHKTLWQFHSGFPNGFGPLQQAAAQYGTAPGIWLSPWGGYGAARQERVRYGKEQGFKIRDAGFSLGDPKYYERFRGLCVDVVRKYGINQFKFDGIGANGHLGVNGREGAGAGLKDFEAMLKLIAELRSLKPEIFINQTTGTWPSPFWLLHADSIWRGGRDYSFVAGTAPTRERWITYRDSDVHDEIVGRSDLYPLNSLMLCGIIYATAVPELSYNTNNILKSDIRAFFGSGTQLQELYITPSLLAKDDWDTLAEAAKWSRANAATLLDSHWVGGAPAKGQIYGWAAWSSAKGILTLRNPSTSPGEIAIDPQKAFELPDEAARHYTIENPFKDQSVVPKTLVAGEETIFHLNPFEVLVVEALPQK